MGFIVGVDGKQYNIGRVKKTNVSQTIGNVSMVKVEKITGEQYGVYNISKLCMDGNTIRVVFDNAPLANNDYTNSGTYYFPTKSGVNIRYDSHLGASGTTCVTWRSGYGKYNSLSYDSSGANIFDTSGKYVKSYNPGYFTDPLTKFGEGQTSLLGPLLVEESDGSVTMTRGFYCFLPLAPGHITISNFYGYVNSDGDLFLPTNLFTNYIPLEYVTDGGYPGKWKPEEGGGGGTGSIPSAVIGYPELPDTSIADSGFVTVYNPTIAQVKNLASYMWSTSLFDLATWQKLFADPMDCILSLMAVPCTVPHGSTAPVKVGNIETTIEMPKASANYVAVDCGTISLKEITGSYLDYAPYTKCEIYLPYIGIRPLDVDDVMGGTIGVRYHIDITTGACVCFIKCGDTVRYTYAGTCGVGIPVTSASQSDLVRGVISVAGAIGSTVATGGASAPAALATVASAATNSLKPDVSRSGSVSGTAGYMSIQKPYILLTVPNLALPEAYKKVAGYPSLMSGKIGAFSGYTKVAECHVEGFACTAEEADEIERLLKEGVIL